MENDKFLKRTGFDKISFEYKDRSRKTMADVLDEFTKPIDDMIIFLNLQIHDLYLKLDEAETPNIEMSIKILIYQKKFALDTLSKVVSQCNV